MQCSQWIRLLWSILLSKMTVMGRCGLKITSTKEESILRTLSGTLKTKNFELRVTPPLFIHNLQLGRQASEHKAKLEKIRREVDINFCDRACCRMGIQKPFKADERRFYVVSKCGQWIHLHIDGQCGRSRNQLRCYTWGFWMVVPG